MASSYGVIIWCEACGDMVVNARVSGGATAAGVAESGSINAEDVEDDIATALRAGALKTRRGRCWVCVCEEQHSVEPFPEAVREKD